MTSGQSWATRLDGSDAVRHRMLCRGAGSGQHDRDDLTGPSATREVVHVATNANAFLESVPLARVVYGPGRRPFRSALRIEGLVSVERFPVWTPPGPLPKMIEPKGSSMDASDPHFRAVLTHLDGYARVKLSGVLDYTATQTHSGELEQLTALRRNVVIDVAELTFIDTSGLAALVAVASDHEGPVRIEGITPTQRRLLTLTGLDQVFDIRD